MLNTDADTLAKQLVSGDRRALARAITLVESSKPEHRQRADSLLEIVMPHTGNAIRVGISGVPGVGKSTFIETLGLHITESGKALAVLTIDPSSEISGGSILGDKTRMQRLAESANAFIRPSPTGGALGGVARRTREGILLCEAAGYDVIFVETVGVGQSETAVANMTDMFVLLLLPGGGDELQGIKRGIVELADLVLVNKADGDLQTLAEQTAVEYASALRMLRPRTASGPVKVETCSALTHTGIPECWSHIMRHTDMLRQTDALGQRRAHQARRWMWDEVADELATAMKRDKRTSADVAEVDRLVTEGSLPASVAARRLVRRFLDR